MSLRFNNSDLGNAQRFAAMHATATRYCYPWGRWLVFDGRRWSVDESGEVERRAKATVKAMYAEALTLTDDQRAALTKHALETERRAARIAAMIDLARSEPGVAVQPEQLDCDPWALNVQNGTIDLRTGELRPHDRADLLTKVCPVAFDRTAGCPTWVAFMARIFAGNASLIGYVQRLFGYCMSGDVREQLLGILWGCGSNGKSTLLNLFMSDLLGPDYAMKAPHDLLMVKGDSHPTERADLHGKRLVAAIETDDGKRLAESLVKELTGGDAIRARRMRENYWEFRPTHKLVLCTNHKPSVRGTDHAIWRRIRLIPFTVTIPDSEQDKNLPAKLRAELPGILNWSLAGCLAWQRDGLGMPDDVAAATNEYRSAQDVLGAFFNEVCVLGDGCRVKAGDLYASYTRWCDDAGERALKRREFGDAMKERGFESRKASTMWFLGIGQREE